MKTKRLLTTLSLAFGLMNASAGEFRPESVSATAAWYVHGDVETFRETETAKFFEEHWEKKIKRTLKQIELFTGFNILEDTRDFTLYGDGVHEDGVGILRANFDKDQLIKIAKASLEYDTSTHGDITVHTWLDEDSDKINHGAFYKDDHLIISEQKKNVHLALDVLQGKKESLTTNILTLNLRSPLVIGLADLDKVPIDENDEGAALLAHAQSLAIGLVEKDGKAHLEGLIKVRDVQKGRKLKSMLNGLLAFVELADEGSLPKLDYELELEEDLLRASINTPLKDLFETAKGLINKKH